MDPDSSSLRGLCGLCVFAVNLPTRDSAQDAGYAEISRRFEIIPG
jgi:hypothetical protein